MTWYKSQLAKLDKRLLDIFVLAYDTLHLALGYDGNLDADVAQAGLKRLKRLSIGSNSERLPFK
ncbi:DUF5618 family protein [Spirosoma luteum]|uniref:DUF5618 family protein n=1 Tax=Spirosoma luteum TaxID=431553 RepID=UPI00039B6917